MRVQGPTGSFKETSGGTPGWKQAFVHIRNCLIKMQNILLHQFHDVILKQVSAPPKPEEDPALRLGIGMDASVRF